MKKLIIWLCLFNISPFINSHECSSTGDDSVCFKDDIGGNLLISCEVSSHCISGAYRHYESFMLTNHNSKTPRYLASFFEIKNVFFSFLTVPWHEFDWKGYVAKDWKPDLDEDDPVSRFGIHLKNSIELGVNRTIPENR